MGMTANYRRITSSELEQIQSDPTAAERYFGWDIDLDDDERFFAYYEALQNSGRYLDIDKAWHALQFVLTGNASYESDAIPLPLNNVVAGGTATQWESSIGFVRVLHPQEVRQVSEALSFISKEDLLPRLDPASFNANRIYPHHDRWVREGMEELLDIYEEVANFFHSAAQAGDCILLAIN
jgi:hypothetical protein